MTEKKLVIVLLLLIIIAFSYALIAVNRHVDLNSVSAEVTVLKNYFGKSYAILAFDNVQDFNKFLELAKRLAK